MTTHWIDRDEPRQHLGSGGYVQRALCGAVVEPTAFALDPTCMACCAALARRDAALAALVSDGSDADEAPPPPRRPFNPTAGYRPRRRMR